MILGSKRVENCGMAAHALLHADDMRKPLCVALCLPLTACVVGSAGEGDDDSGGDTAITGPITADRTLSGTNKFTGTTTIGAGVTVTVDSGSTLNFTSGSGLTVDGTLLVNGSKDNIVTIQHETGQVFSGLSVSGTLTMTYADQHDGSIRTSPGAKVTITDTLMYGAHGGDFLIMNGGEVTVSYSQFGAPAGITDTTHCHMHFDGAGNTISITRSNINAAPYGVMFYSGTGSVFTDNNWDCTLTNCVDVDTLVGVNGDFSNSFFKKGAPTARPGATITANNLSGAPLTDAGIR